MDVCIYIYIYIYIRNHFREETFCITSLFHAISKCVGFARRASRRAVASLGRRAMLPCFRTSVCGGGVGIVAVFEPSAERAARHPSSAHHCLNYCIYIYVHMILYYNIAIILYDDIIVYSICIVYAYIYIYIYAYVY